MLNNGIEMPIIGLGVYQTQPGKTTEQAVSFALRDGYRLIDTAKLYANESDVGRAISKGIVPRDEVFVTTKLWVSDEGYDTTLKAFDRSLSQLDTGYIDLYLIHYPVPRKRLESWKAMTKLLKDGRVRAIGVSNYTIHHLKEVLDSSDVVPAVNQVEFHPFLYQKDLLDFCRRNRIQLEAYSPLARGRMFDNGVIKTIAKKHGRTSAQVMIRWGLQHGLVEIPKSARKERITENSQVFDFTLSQEDMDALNALNQDRHMDWDPTDEP
jgi:methylglyoxal/glyoxal reductase